MPDIPHCNNQRICARITGKPFLDWHLSDSDEIRLKPEEHKYRPPRIGERLLKFIYDDSLIDDILGDLDEIYQDRAEVNGATHAKMLYLKDAVMSFRNYDLRKNKKVTQNNTLPMVSNYVKTTFRTLSKNRIYSFPLRQ